MAPGLDTLRDRAAQILACKDSETAFAVFCETISLFGFEFIIAARGITELGPKPLPALFHFNPAVEAFLQNYIEKGAVYIDPILVHSAKMDRPFRWRDSYIDLSEQQTQHIESARQFGLNYGVLIPVPMGQGLRGLVSLGCRDDFDLSMADMIELEVLARYMFERTEVLTTAEVEMSALSLSPREREILDYVAKGKTNWEIGQIMSISEYSVRDYLKNISARLDTSNRTNTVVKAIQLGLLLP